MSNRVEFRQPVGGSASEDGTYVTVAQLQFYLNRPYGNYYAQQNHRKFKEYLDVCRVYNLVWDLTEKDEKASIIYWDSIRQTVSVGYPHNGKVAKAVKNVILLSNGEFDSSDFFENPWGY
jgi:hypothetical protein